MVIHVTSVYRQGRRGSKAWIRQDGTARERDAWFWNYTPQQGQTLVVSASSGWGPHYQRSDVLYIGREGAPGVYEALPAGTHAAAEKYWRKQGNRQ